MQLRAVGNTVSDLTGTRFELQASRSIDEPLTARLNVHFQLNVRGTEFLFTTNPVSPTWKSKSSRRYLQI